MGKKKSQALSTAKDKCHYHLTGMWNLKNKQTISQAHRYTEETGVA